MLTVYWPCADSLLTVFWLSSAYMCAGRVLAMS